MQLRNPGPGAIDNALQWLRNVQGDSASCLAAQTFPQAAKRYVEWVDMAHDQLGNHFVDDRLIEDLYSPQYWEILRLLNSGPQLPTGGWGLIRREQRIQSDRLERAHAKLLELKRVVDREGHIVVLDASALLRGTWFEDFDWPRELDLRSSVRLVLPILVIEELDGVKDRERTTKAGDRARRVLRRLRDLFGTAMPSQPIPLPTRASVTVEVLIDDDWHQRRPNNDSEIVAQALSIASLAGRDVTLICVDASMEFRARQQGLSVFAMSTAEDLASASQ